MTSRDVLRRLRRGSSPAGAAEATTTPAAPDEVTFSVVLPIYESRPEFLAQQLDAIRHQEHERWECVVVDDGSTDRRGVELAERHAADDPRFRVHRRPANGGIAAATNDALDRTTGDWIVFCDHDDVIHRSALTRLAEHIAANPADDVVYTDERLVDEGGDVIADYRKPDFSPQRFTSHNYFCHIVTMRRRLVEQIGRLDARFEPSADREFNMRAVRAACAVGHVREVLYDWRAISGSLALSTGAKSGVAESVRRSAEEHLAALGQQGTAIDVVGNTTSVHIRRRPWPDDVAELVVDDTTTLDDLDRGLRGTASRFVALRHIEARPVAPDWAAALAAACAATGATMVGARLVSDDGRLVSGGRVHSPSLADLFAGVAAAEPGPWGAFTVEREVASVSPLAAVVDREAILRLGGPEPEAVVRRVLSMPVDETALWDLDHRVALDLACAVLGTASWSRGRPALWCPTVTVTVPSHLIADDDRRALLAAAQRHVAAVYPAILEDPYSPTGAFRLPAVAAAPTATTSDGLHQLGSAAALLDGGHVDLLTCDVFDTLVWRPVAEPDHLFVELGRRLIAERAVPSHVTPHDVHLGRVVAEQRARERNRRLHEVVECTLEEIWAQMPRSWLAESARSEDDPWDRYLRTELALEAEVLRPHDVVVSLLRRAHDAGVRTVLVSDTYFSETQLRELLGAAGVPLDLVDRVVTSSEAGLPKYDGLLARIVDEEGVDAARVLHVGDNPVADVRAARELGANVLPARRPDAELAAPAVLAALHEASLQLGADAGVTATVHAAMLETGATHDDAGEQFGTTVGGPLLHGFARWVSATAAALGVEHVHCLLREGDTIGDVLESVGGAGPQARRVHASRWVNLRAAVIDGTPDELYRALARKELFHPRHVVEAFGCDARLVERVLGDRPILDEHRVDAMHRIAEHDELRGEIVAASAVIRRRLLGYLDTVLEPTDGRLVVCDIGWGGTIQEGLRDVLLHEGRLKDPDDLVGLYLMLSPAGTRRVAMGQRLLSYLPVGPADRAEVEVVTRNPEILEQLCTPPIGTLLDIDETGRPIVAERDSTATASRERARSAALRAAQRLADASGDAADAFWSDEHVRHALLVGVAGTLQTPTPALAAELATWLHDDVAGDAVVPLADVSTLDSLPYLNAADLSAITMRDVFWLPGAAALGNPALAAQLDASRRGVDPDALCPPSPTGRASVAVYSPGSEDAVALAQPWPRTSASGWSVLKMAASCDSVRDIRIDLGETDLLVELAFLRLRLHRGAGSERVTVDRRIERTDDAWLRWVDGVPVGASFAALARGGFLLVPLRGRPEAASHLVEIECAFRAAPLGDDDRRALLRRAPAERLRRLARRAVVEVRDRRPVRRQGDAYDRGDRS